MKQSKHESIPFWECENNCWEVLISQAVSECNLWADSRDKLISQHLHSSLNSLWLTGQGTGGDTVHIPQRRRCERAVCHTCGFTPVSDSKENMHPSPDLWHRKRLLHNYYLQLVCKIR